MKVTAERIRELAFYDAESGKLIRKIRRGGRGGNGSAMGHAAGNGYLYAGIDYGYYTVHRLIWLYVTGEWPTEMIDHINGNKIDNRISNLRLATRSLNAANSKARSSKKKKKGVYYDCRRDKFYAHISYEGRKMHIGAFDDANSAHEAYMRAASKRYGEFSRFE